MSKLPLLVAALLSVLALAQQSIVPSPAVQDLQPGIVLAKVSCPNSPDQSYALYLPSHYTREKRWPIVYAFDPGARGRMPVELMKDAAERYGCATAPSFSPSFRRARIPTKYHGFKLLANSTDYF